MKIKRFQAEDVRSTIRKVRETLGPDAVILSNKKVADGVEIVAAIDYDESLMGGVVAQPEAATSLSSQSVAESYEAKSAAAGSHTKVNRRQAEDDVRYSRNIPQQHSTTAVETPAAKPASTDSAMIKAKELSEVQNEIKSLRGLLLNQLSGMAWETESKSHPVRTRLLQRLIALGLSPVLAKKLCEEVEDTEEFDVMWRQALGKLSHKLPVIDNGVLKTGGVMALVGPTGVGKTTTIAKLAARFVLQHGKDSVGLITTDNFRVAAHEQLRSYARIMGVPLRVATDKDE